MVSGATGSMTFASTANQLPRPSNRRLVAVRYSHPLYRLSHPAYANASGLIGYVHIERLLHVGHGGNFLNSACMVDSGSDRHSYH